MDVDFLLISKMKMGDDMAIDAFVQKYYHTILKYCCLHIGDYGYAEDLTQETFEHFFRTLSQYHHYGKALNYLYAIAANACKDYLRKGKAIKENEITSEQFPEPSDPMENIEHLDVRMDLKNALDRLPLELKEVAILYFVQERKQKDIAEILGIGLPLVKYRVKRARELLCEFMAY